MAQEAGPLIVGPGEPLQVEAPGGGRVELALDGGVVRPLQEGLRAPDQGRHWLALVSRDAVGAVSPVRWIRLIVDAEPPECCLSFDPGPVKDPAGRLWIRPGKVSLEAHDDLAGPASVKLTVGGSVAAGGVAAATAPLQREGPARIGGVCVDVVGNRGTAPAVELTVDRTPPRGTLALEGTWVQAPGSPVAAPDVEVVARWDDALSGVAGSRISRDGTWQRGDRLTGPWEEGEHRVEARAVDRVGNEAPGEILRFVVDATPPSLSCSPEPAPPAGAAGAGVTWVSGKTVLRCTAEDAPAGVESVEQSTDGTAWSPAPSRIPLTPGGVRVRARDRVGNVAEIVPPYRVDAVPPALKVVSPDGRSWPASGEIVLHRGDAVVIEGVDGESGLARLEYRIGGGGWAPVEHRVVFRDTGTFLLEIRAVDRAGNQARRRQPVRVIRKTAGGK